MQYEGTKPTGGRNAYVSSVPIRETRGFKNTCSGQDLPSLGPHADQRRTPVRHSIDTPMSTVSGPPQTDVSSPASGANSRRPEGDATAAPGQTMSSWSQISWQAVGWVGVVGVLFLLLSHHPLYHTDIWGHLAYGRWVWEHGQLLQTEPLLPLCEGVPFVDTAWISRVFGYGLFRAFGVTGLQWLYSVPITVSVALLLWGVLRRTGGSIVAGLVLLATFSWVNYQQLLIVRPQLNGLMMFTALLVLMTASRWHRWYWIFLPLMFTFWANLHGSWIVGLGLLGTLTAGRAIDIARRTRDVRFVVADRMLWRYLGVTLLAAAAVLINPYGIGLYHEVFAVSRNPNLPSLIEWKPLSLEMSQGRAAAAAVIALIVAYCLTPRRINAAELLLLFGLGGAAIWSSRMLHWWAPVAAYYLAVHVGAVIRRWRKRSRSNVVPTKSAAASLSAAAIMIACALATPLGQTLLHGRPTDAAGRVALLRESTSPQTPIAAASYLRRHPVDGLIYNSYEWGDFLLFAGPRDLQLFTNSHAHLIPQQVWLDALTIWRAGNGWDKLLDEYDVTTVVLNKVTARPLIKGLQRDSDQWAVAYEDRLTIIFRRSR